MRGVMKKGTCSYCTSEDVEVAMVEGELWCEFCCHTFEQPPNEPITKPVMAQMMNIFLKRIKALGGAE